MSTRTGVKEFQTVRKVNTNTILEQRSDKSAFFDFFNDTIEVPRTPRGRLSATSEVAPLSMPLRGRVTSRPSTIFCPNECLLGVEVSRIATVVVPVAVKRRSPSPCCLEAGPNLSKANSTKVRRFSRRYGNQDTQQRNLGIEWGFLLEVE
jgi:hypothetical protein